MILFLEKFHIDIIFVALLGVAAFLFFLYNFLNVIKYKTISSSRSKKTLKSLAYLVSNICAITKKAFLNHIVNNGTYTESKISIDRTYLSDNSSVYIKKR